MGISDDIRHLATVGALTVIGVSLGFDFFIQQLVTLPTGYWSDGSPAQIQPNSPDVLNFYKQSSTNQSTPLPQSLQIARIANATNYTYTTVGEPPCKSLTPSIMIIEMHSRPHVLTCFTQLTGS
jgi:hypothetical protein